jgi:hypothetical protein
MVRDHVGDTDLGAELRRHQSALGVESAKARLGCEQVSLPLRLDMGAKAQFSNPRTQHEGNKKTVLNRSAGGVLMKKSQ